MRKFIPALLLSLFCYLWGYGQHTISGRIIDEQEEAIDYATVALLNPADSILQYFGVSNSDGRYQIKAIKAGDYILQFSYVGTQTIYEPLRIPNPDGEDLGTRQLQANVLKEVIVEAELIPVQYKNDTLEFDVRAFKTRPGAAAEELLRQLPGVEVDNAGNIKAEGESVVKVLVDGKEFFDDDPKVATKNLPADALRKVQVIDRKTEQAVFSGIDDGIREKTINLELKEDRKKGYFGEVGGGGGTNETYQVAGDVYRFSQNTQTALLGQFNNINDFGFTNKDNNQFGENNKGINKALAAGLNFSYNPSDQNRYFISYLGNRRVKDLNERVQAENFLPDGTFEQIQDITEEDIDQLHKLNIGARHNFNEQQRLIFDAGVNTNVGNIFSATNTASLRSGKMVNAQNNETTNQADLVNAWTQATFIAKSEESNTQFKLEVGSTYNNDANRLDWTNNTRFFDPTREEMITQFQTNDQDRFSFYANPSILQRLNTQWSISAGLRFETDDRGLIRREGTRNDQSKFDERLIPDFSTRQQILRPGLDFNRNGKKAQLNLRLSALTNRFDKRLDAVSLPREHYFFFTPGISYRNEYKSGRRVNLNYAMGANMPTVNQLFPVRNVIDPLNVIQGNPDLKPERSQSLSVNWTLFDQFSFTGVSFRLSGDYTRDKIRWAQTIDEKLVKLSRPINVESDLNLQSYLDFSTPLRSLGFNLNLTLIENWNRGIVFINEVENINTNFTHNLSIALENRNNDIFALRLSAALNVTDSRFSIAEARNNVFLNTSYVGQINYTPGKRWNFEARANVMNYNARSFDESISVPLLSASIDYFFGQAEKANLRLSAFDILNQYTGIQRTANNNFLMERQWNTLSQYFMLSLNLRFR